MTTPSDPQANAGPKDHAEAAHRRRYWDTHPISTDSVPHAAGTAESFDALYTRWKQGIDEMRLECLESCHGARVFEVGCGIALDGRYLSEHGVHYQAVDQSLGSLLLARRHFDLANLPQRFIAGDARRLPIADEEFDQVFSMGVLHHAPDTAKACREVVRITRPGGTVRVMLYNRNSYFYVLVDWVVRPVLWLMLKFPLYTRLLPLAPQKIRYMYEICLREGFDRRRILSISTDTSFAGEGHFNPFSDFFTERDMREMFGTLEDFRFIRTNLSFFPLPFFRSFVEKRWGFFLTMIARKPLRDPSGSAS